MMVDCQATQEFNFVNIPSMHSWKVQGETESHEVTAFEWRQRAAILVFRQEITQILRNGYQDRFFFKFLLNWLARDTPFADTV